VTPASPPATAAAPDAAASVAAKPEGARRTLDWVPYLPFGIGHFDRDHYGMGFAFLGLDLMVVSASVNELFDPRRTGANLWILAAPAIIGGAYGYELLDVLPLISPGDPAGAESARERLSFFPFGVGQAKNGQVGKAIGFGVAEALFLSQAVNQTEPSGRALGVIGFLIAYAYGSYDAWSNHVPLAPGKADASPSGFRLGLAPTWSVGARPGVQLTAGYALP
jgi:hypothetical protein